MPRPSAEADGTGGCRPSEPVSQASIRRYLDGRGSYILGRRYQKQSLALFLLRIPAFVPLIFIMRGWLSLNAKDVLANRKPTCWERGVRSASS
jgi:hypothetical protein